MIKSDGVMDGYIYHLNFYYATETKVSQVSVSDG